MLHHDRLDAGVTIVLVVLVVMVLAESMMEWVRVVSGRKEARLTEAPFVQSKLAGDEA